MTSRFDGVSSSAQIEKTINLPTARLLDNVPTNQRYIFIRTSERDLFLINGL